MPGIERVNLQFDEGSDRTCVYETDDIQVMRIRLAVGEALPHHDSNSNVLLVAITGTIELTVPGKTETFSVGAGMSVPVGTPMDLKNVGAEPALFLVLKTPHPKTLK